MKTARECGPVYDEIVVIVDELRAALPGWDITLWTEPEFQVMGTCGDCDFTFGESFVTHPHPHSPGVMLAVGAAAEKLRPLAYRLPSSTRALCGASSPAAP